MLSEDDIREQLSLAYVHAVASSAGYAWERTNIDRDGIDGRVMGRGLIVPDALIKSPMLGVQVKATTTVLGAPDPIPFALKQSNYEKLLGRFAEPRYLALLLLPPEQDQWLSVSTENLVLRLCMYWMSLASLGETANTTSTTVYIPRKNVLDASAMRRLMESAARQEVL